MINSLLPVLVYAALALLANAAGTHRARANDKVTVFPILLLYRVLGWVGGSLCGIVAFQEIQSRGFDLLSLFSSTIAIATLFLPLQSVAISAEGLESLPILFRRRVVIPWAAIEKVERRDSWGWIIVYGHGSCITLTRFNADRSRFESLRKSRVKRDLWIS